MNHEVHEEHEVIRCAIGDLDATFRVNPIAAPVFNGSLIFFVFLRVLRGELLFLGLYLSDTPKKAPTTMLAVKLDTQMEEELEKLAAATGRSKRFYVNEALAAYLEDRADYWLALAAFERDEPRTSLADVRRELGLER